MENYVSPAPDSEDEDFCPDWNEARRGEDTCTSYVDACAMDKLITPYFARCVYADLMEGLSGSRLD